MRAPLAEFVRRTLAVLDSQAFPYVVYGGIAVPAWSNPRVTQDLDVVLLVAEENLSDVLDALDKAGFRAESDSHIRFAVDKWTRVHLQGRHADLAQGTTAFDQSAFDRRNLAYLRTWAGEIAARTGKFEVPQKLEEMLESFYFR